jgi:hypothetical protein
MNHKGLLFEISSAARDRYGCDGFSEDLKRIVNDSDPSPAKNAGSGF